MSTSSFENKGLKGSRQGQATGTQKKTKKKEVVRRPSLAKFVMICHRARWLRYYEPGLSTLPHVPTHVRYYLPPTGLGPALERQMEHGSPGLMIFFQTWKAI